MHEKSSLGKAVKWSDDYAVGVPEIDAQHAAMFERVDALLVACEEGRAKDEIVGLFTFLEEYARKHFADEEALMNAIGFSECREHQAQHQEYIDEIGRFRAVFELEGANALLAAELNAYLVNWLISHITVEDLRIATFMRNHGR